MVLHSGLSESAAQGIIVILRGNGIVAQKVVEESGQDRTWKVIVATKDASNAWQVLVENDLPREEPKGFAEFFGKSKLIPTETEEKAIFLQALCGELAKTIEAMPSVIDARVHVSIPEKDPLRQLMEGEEPPRPTAAVMVKHWKPQGTVPPEERIDDRDIKKLVASSVEALNVKDVAVVIKAITPMSAQAASGGKTDPTMFFLPLAGVTGVLLILLLFMMVRNRSLAKQLAERMAQPSAESSDVESQP